MNSICRAAPLTPSLHSPPDLFAPEAPANFSLLRRRLTSAGSKELRQANNNRVRWHGYLGKRSCNSCCTKQTSGPLLAPQKLNAEELGHWNPVLPALLPSENLKGPWTIQGPSGRQIQT